MHASTATRPGSRLVRWGVFLLIAAATVAVELLALNATESLAVGGIVVGTAVLAGLVLTAMERTNVVGLAVLTGTVALVAGLALLAWRLAGID